MNKDVLIIDHVEKCEDCPCYLSAEQNLADFQPYCKAKKKTIDGKHIWWCPLHKLPEKMTEKTHDDYQAGYKAGFNNALELLEI